MNPIGKDTTPSQPSKAAPDTGWRKLHHLSDFVRTILGLSEEESAVLDAVRSFQMPKRAAEIAIKARIDRKKANRILKRLESRHMIIRSVVANRHDHWRYNRKLSQL